MSLRKSINDGEGKTIEFKVELPNSSSLAKTIVAFSNTVGGKIIIGVNDQGKIIGLGPGY
jgi:ATP-dependent DNA helicase RecG